MSANGSKFFTAMVIGEEPDKLMKKYDKSLKVEPYIKYKYLDAKKMQSATIKSIEAILSDPKKFGLNQFNVDMLTERKKVISNMTSFEYYQNITDGMFYDENGNAICEDNPNGKWDNCSLGKNFAIPLLTKDGKEVYQARNKDIDWDKIITRDQTLYNVTWEMIVEGRDPETPEETTIYHAMSDKKDYFSNFKNKEDYVSYSCSYWNYAYVDKNGWKDVDDKGKEQEWLRNFYKTFVKPLKPDDLVSIYEYSRRN